MTHELHIVTGAAGVGKSTYARSLAAKCNAALLDSDTLSDCLLYTSPSPRDRQKSRMPSSA